MKEKEKGKESEEDQRAGDLPAGRSYRVALALSAYRWEVDLDPDGAVRMGDVREAKRDDPLSRWIQPPPPVGELSALELRMAGRSLAVEPGLTLLMAPTGWGKTLFLNHLRPAADGRRVSGELATVEAIEANELEPMLPLAITSLLELAWRGRCEGRGTLLLLDSLRELVYGPSLGGTGEGGVNLFAAMQLTALSNVFIWLDAHLIAAFNPLVDRSADRGEAKWAQLREVMTGSVAVWEGTSRGNLELHNRGPVDDQRQSEPFSFGTLSPLVTTPAAVEPARATMTLAVDETPVPPSFRRSLLRASADPKN